MLHQIALFLSCPERANSRPPVLRSPYVASAATACLWAGPRQFGLRCRCGCRVCQPRLSAAAFAPSAGAGERSFRAALRGRGPAAVFRAAPHHRRAIDRRRRAPRQPVPAGHRKRSLQAGPTAGPDEHAFGAGQRRPERQPVVGRPSAARSLQRCRTADGISRHAKQYRGPLGGHVRSRVHGCGRGPSTCTALRGERLTSRCSVAVGARRGQR